MALESLITLLASFAIIVVGCELFTNGVEWFGFKLKLSEGATGSVLAAVGTAMPETVVPIIAILFGSTQELAHEIGIGAILGAPFMLSTLTMFVGGLTILIASTLKMRSAKLNLNRKATKFDLRFFFLVYTFAIIPAMIRVPVLRYAVALLLVLCYVVYLKMILAEMEPIGEADNRLHFSKFLSRSRRSPQVGLIAVQVLAALSMILGGARIFVSSIEKISIGIGISAAILAFVIAPVATELPEKFNSVLWYLRKRDTLAMGNITGAMVFQSSVLPAIGLTLTPWQLEPAEIGGMLLAILSAFTLYVAVVKGRLNAYLMLIGGAFYVGYIGYVISHWN